MATASSSPVPWIEKNTGTSGLSVSQAVDHAFGHHIGTGESTAEIDHQAFHPWIRQHQFERGRRLGIGFATDLEEIGRTAARMADHVHGGHGQARPVGEQANLAVQLEELEAEIGAFLFERATRLVGAAGHPFFLAKPGGIVDAQLAVKRHETTVGLKHATG